MRPPRTPPARACAPAVLVTVAVGAGCADLHYQRLALGQAPAAYERVLPAGDARRTDFGLCYASSDWTRRTDAIVVLSARDRRLAAKIQATHVHRDFGLRTETSFRLRGELDPKLADVASTGALDALRALLQQLQDYRGEKTAVEAHAWVAAGLVRLLQRWPNLSDQVQPAAGLSATLERVPAGGRAWLAVDERGAYLFEYRVGFVP